MMRNRLLLFVLLFLLNDVEAIARKLVEDLKETQSFGNSKYEVVEKLYRNGLSENIETFIVYVLDASCSTCIVNYLCFLQSINGTEFIDRVVVVVENQCDFLSVDYYRDKIKAPEPRSEVLIYDVDGKINEKIVSSVGYCNILLIENKSLKCCYNVSEYKYDEELGLIR